MATLSDQDKLLNADQQKQIQMYKDQWANATTQAERDAAHAGAEAIRKSAGYSGGDDGSGVLLNNQTAQQQTQSTGGKSADEVAKWVEDYRAANLGSNGWNNGYSVAMNLRSQANYIRQQMDANSKAWANADAATREYLHDQNVQLSKILEDAVGGAQSTYNEKLGRWETDNANLGYGFNTGQYNDLDWYKNFYGMTDDQIKQYQNDTDRYYNFVDQRVVRNWQDESSGFTGEYAQFVNGPYAQLLGGTNGVPRSIYVDIIGDNFGGEDEYEPVRDENGNIVAQAPALKNNNASDYTRNLAAYTENGVILPNILNGSKAASKTDDNLYLNMNGSGPNYATSMDAAEAWYPKPGDLYNDRSASVSSGSTATGTSSLESYLKEIYAANLESQKAQLEAAYQQNLAELEESLRKSDASYTEQKRQTAGTAEQQAASWREMANALGLNSGAFGQAALAQSNQLQSNLNALNNAQATAQADIEQQRALLGQQYQLAILEAQANNDFELANALYSEAVRQDEALRQQEQFNAQLQLQYAQMAQSLLGTLISNSDGITLNGGLSAGSGALGGTSATPYYYAADTTDETQPSDSAKAMVDSIKQYNNQYGGLSKDTMAYLIGNRTDISDTDAKWMAEQLGL